MNKKNILFVGCMPPPIGGVTVLSKQLYKSLKEYDGFDTIFFDSIKRTNIVNYLFEYIKQVKKSDLITLQFADIFSKYHFIFCIIAKLYKKPIVLRCFAGSAHTRYQKFNKMKKFIYNKSVLNSDIVLFETKKNVDFFSKIIKNKIYWFPNNKKFNNNIDCQKTKALRFCFFGQIKKSKGILEIYKASNELPNNILIDIFGPLGFDISNEEIVNFNNKYLAKYKGCIDSDKVTSIMKNYDVLLLPTYHEGEGYPGVIMEAYNLGMPVITTLWNSIPEIVDSKSGILIEIKSYDQLRNAILNLYNNNNLFIEMQKGAIEKAKLFDSKYWNDYFVSICNKVLNLELK